MPITDRNYSRNIRQNTEIRYSGNSTTMRPQEEEQRIANAVLQDKLEIKNTPISRMTGLKTSVIYYQQKTIGRNDYLVNTTSLNTIDVNKRNFIKILDFVILCTGEASYQSSPTEISIDINVDGEAKVLPQTIKPLVGDFFIMSVGDKNCLFKITGVNKTSIETDCAYAITYTLDEDILGEKYSQLETCTTETRHFIYSHVGTSFRTIFREDEYIALDKLSKMYETMAEVYNRLFYNKDKNTYILNYTALDIKDESGTPLEESRLQNQPFVVAPDKDIPTTVSKPKLNDSDVWFGSMMYDRMLIEFITKNRIFDRVCRKLYRVSQLQQDLERWYHKTIFYAIEHQQTTNLRFKTFIPAPITRVTIASTLNLYGVVSLEPCIEPMGNTLELYPNGLLECMLWGGKDKSDSDITVNTYKDMIDLMNDCIGLYTRKKDSECMSRLLLMYEHFEDFYQLSIRDQNQFYLFPIIAFIITKMMDRLSDDNFGLSVPAQSLNQIK